MSDTSDPRPGGPRKGRKAQDCDRSRSQRGFFSGDAHIAEYLFQLLTSSRTLLGREGVVTERAGTDPTGKCTLEFTEDSVEGQSCPVAFGSVNRKVVRNRCAAVTRVAW
jgi:hypothetical protein